MSNEASRRCEKLRPFFTKAGETQRDVQFICDEIAAKRKVEVNMIRFLDRNRHSNTPMRWQVDRILNSSYASTRDVLDELESYERGERAIYSRMVDER